MDYNNEPFLTEDFSPEGGGIDFLGLRQVNLHILEKTLLPGINNQTTDPGTYCIGTWIPWKFEKICQDETTQFTYSNFKLFKELIEIIMSYSIDDTTSATAKFGRANNRIGRTQKIKFPQRLEYKLVKRTDATSIYAAPLYGPSLRYLQLLQEGEAKNIEDKSSGILLANDDSDTLSLCQDFDSLIQKSPYSSKIFQLKNDTFTEDEVDNLSSSGIHPCFFRSMPATYKNLFSRKLLPSKKTDEGYSRTLTYKLIIEIIKNNPNISRNEIRDIMFCRLNHNGEQLIVDEELTPHLTSWSIFMLRQYQRYSLEMFRSGFEKFVEKGFNRIDKITTEVLKENYWHNCLTLRDLLNKELAADEPNVDFNVLAKKWANEVHPTHPDFIGKIVETKNLSSTIRAFKVLSRWWLGIKLIIDENPKNELVKMGGADRVSQIFLYTWMKERLDVPLFEFLSDFLSLFIFNQHLRVSLSRFDGQIQRMRFVLDDNGIVPSTSVGKDFGKDNASWMADRLDCFITLLIEVGKLEETEEGELNVLPSI